MINLVNTYKGLPTCLVLCQAMDTGMNKRSPLSYRASSLVGAFRTCGEPVGESLGESVEVACLGPTLGQPDSLGDSNASQCSRHTG